MTMTQKANPQILNALNELGNAIDLIGKLSDPINLFDSVKAVMFDDRQLAMNGIDHHHRDFQNRAANFQSAVNLIQELLTHMSEAIEAGEPEELWSTRAKRLSIPEWFNHVDRQMIELRQSYRCYELSATRLHAIRKIGEDSGFTEILED